MALPTADLMSQPQEGPGQALLGTGEADLKGPCTKGAPAMGPGANSRPRHAARWPEAVGIWS